ncbi:hypothetical protein JQ617_01305 [Bradyrhizobium sp. KB893862 SZCCT0404]|nr:hypothetical protein [Bradyrhizobium sp. KB893862 SZCCT0404]MBR1172579.1 hypothetical protein [Bradyrhizobium sp. KB893862 SZCCT0404]
MELELREDNHASEPAESKRSEPNAEQAAFTAPFASEGLERLRDSHC